MKILILDTNERLNIDKKTETHIELAEKVKEECKELIEALHGTDMEHIVEEALDVLQLSVGLMDRACSCKGLSLDKQINLHNMKLIGRGWDYKKMLEIQEVKEV